MSVIQSLYNLQQIDTEIDGHKDALGKVEAQLKESDELLQTRASVEQAKVALEEAVKAQKTLEEELGALNEKVKAVEKTMYGGTVKNPKELQGLEAELKMLKKRITEMEEKDVALMGRREDAEKALKAAQERLTQVEADWKESQRKLSAEQRKLRSLNTQAAQKRDAAKAGVPEKDLAQYERLRTTKRGLAVAKLERGMCLGCRIGLPMTLVRRIRIGRELVTCSSCGRLLYGE